MAQLPKLFDDAFYDFVRSIDSYFEKSIKQLNRFFEDHTFPVDMYETETELVIEAKLPDYEKEQIHVSFLGTGCGLL
ncbi:hypothetical protein MUN89_12815 [Halobacillus salinarum]|uniref:Hsp20/alpha crystallin family protein n=1 Tax=Halobacillus salinarum TaxID=2932257 RepID=A0ABY4EG24_9BACI|nr:hypothetical protein [Halobacillus salinarum]UOQ42843.1 hypothetical protein MUN89_12815 [Halobacillus salinarum]